MAKLSPELQAAFDAGRQSQRFDANPYIPSSDCHDAYCIGVCVARFRWGDRLEKSRGQTWRLNDKLVRVVDEMVETV